MRFYKAALFTLVLTAFLFRSSAQAPSTYFQAKNLLEEEGSNRKTFSVILKQTFNLPPNKDSLDWLAPSLISAADGLQRGSDAGEVEILLKMKTYENLSILYSNYYADHLKALEYSSKELAHFEQTDLEESGFGYMYTGALARRMFLLAQLDEIEKSLQVAQQVRERVEIESDSLQRSFGYRQLCVFYHKISDSERGLIICKSGLNDALTSGTPNYLGSFYETLALLLENEGRVSLDSIISLRKKAIQFSSRYAPMFNRVNYRNLGISYLLKQMPDSAEFYFDKSFQLFNDYPWEEGERISSIWLARTYLYKGEVKRALRLVDSIQSEIGSHEYDALAHNLLILGLAEAYNNEILLAADYLKQRDSIISIKYSEERQALKEEYAVKYETAQKEAENQILKAQTQRLLIMVISGFLALASALVILILVIRQAKRKKKLAEKETQVFELKAERENTLRIKAEQELERKKTELREVVNQSMVYQSRNLEMRELVEELHSSIKNSNAEKKARQLQLKLKDFSREDTLAHIDTKAQQAYPKLYNYLKQSLPANSNTELLFCVLIVMDYSQEEIARSMQRTQKAIKSLRYRVRKRLGLSQDQDLKDHLLTETARIKNNKTL